MAGVLVSPRLDDTIRKRNALYKKRNESPKFRDILRERCHARIRASRCALLEKFRNLDNHEEIQSALTGILKEEVKLLTSPSLQSDRSILYNDQEAFHLDELDEDYWLIEEYEKILAEEETHFNFAWEQQVICPICEMSVLSEICKTIKCLKCQTQYPCVGSLQLFKEHLDNALRTHNENCPESAQFVLLNDKELGLFLICEFCCYFSHVL